MGKSFDKGEKTALFGLALACFCAVGVAAVLGMSGNGSTLEKTPSVYVAEQGETVSITGLDFDGTLEVEVLGGRVFSTPSEAGIQRDGMAYWPDVSPEETVFFLVTFRTRNVDATPIWETKSGHKLINVSGIINLENVGDHNYFDGTAAGVNAQTEKLYFDLPVGEEREFNVGWFVPKGSVPESVILGGHEDRVVVHLEIAAETNELPAPEQA